MPGMGFFDSLRRTQPPAPPPSGRRLPEWYHPGPNVAPMLLPFDRVLTRRPELAVFITALRVHPRGFEFDVEVLRRLTGPSQFDAARGNPFAPLVPSGGPEGPAGSGEGHMRFGVRYADGGSTTTETYVMRPPAVATEPEPPHIKPSGGRSMPGHWHQRYWVWGLPGSGDIELVYSWPAEGVAEASFTFDGDAVRAASVNARVLWDEPGEQDADGDAHGNAHGEGAGDVASSES